MLEQRKPLTSEDVKKWIDHFSKIEIPKGGRKLMFLLEDNFFVDLVYDNFDNVIVFMQYRDKDHYMLDPVKVQLHQFNYERLTEIKDQFQELLNKLKIKSP